MPKAVSVRMNLVDGEHLLSGWVRHNIRLGFAHLPFDRCLQYWGLPKQHLKAQRVSGEVVDTVLARITDDRFLSAQLLKQRTNYRLWLLGADELELRRPDADWGRPNLEQNMFAFAMSWQLCPRCIEENHQLLGFSYWHRAHQLPSITHCLKHGSPLVTHADLIRLDRLVLPMKYLGLQLKPVRSVEALSGWSYFVGIIDQLIEKDPLLPALWRKSVRQVLALPTPIRQKHRGMIRELSQQMEQDVGEALLAHLFRAWREQRARRPDILWSTLSGVNPQKSIRHPVYWLLILYWLRNKLPRLKDI